MTEDIFADQSHGAIALQKIAPTDSNFRLFKPGWWEKGRARVCKATLTSSLSNCGMSGTGRKRSL
jgi:hypothetical protein